MNYLIEPSIIRAVRKLLAGRVNELLLDAEFSIPAIEFGEYRGGDAVVPAIALSACERTEKERIIRLDAYSLSISFTVPETLEAEWQCYAYAAAVSRAVAEDPTLGGIADRAVITGKKYSPPKRPYCGEGWGVAISLRVTVETAGRERFEMSKEQGAESK